MGLEAVLAQQPRAVRPEALRVLDEAEAVDVAAVRDAVTTEQVEAAHRLPQGWG